jgi:protein-S-isoprenylcysteine O-methyltransferase Ste14
MDDKEGTRPGSTPDEGARVGSRCVSAGAALPPQRQYLLYGFFFKTRGLMAGILLFAMFFTIRGNWGSDALNWAVGLPLFAAAFLLRIRSQQYLRYRLRDRSDLATSGPYAYVRNPVYIANMTGLGALCILCAVYWMAPIAVAWAALVYHLSVRFEEMRLAKCHGERYRRYLERVPRWIPRRSPAMDAGNGRAGFWQAARVEWQNLLLLLVPLGKIWTFRSDGGSVHAVLDRLVSPVLAHAYAFLVVFGIGVVCLAALNLKRLRSYRRKKAERATGRGLETQPSSSTCV